MAQRDREHVAFPQLDDAQMSGLEQVATCKSFHSGERLFAAGERDFKFFVIKSGAVEIVEQSSGEDKIVTVHEAREFTGDIDMLTGRSAVVSAIAKGDCEVYEISAVDLRRIIHELPHLGEVLLRAFLMRRELLEESGFTGLRVVGSRFSRETHRIREFLAKNKVPFTWIDLENDPRVDALLGQFHVSAEETPVVACGKDTMVRNPSNAQLAECIGIKKPLDHTVYDLAVIGAGPAGLAAAVYGASEGLKTLVLDKMGPGGQAGTSSKIENYMGFPTGLSGADLANRAVLQAQKFGAILSAPSEVVSLAGDPGYHVLQLDTGEDVVAKSILVATGASYRKIGVDGCARLEGSGVYYAATAVEAQMCHDAEVVVVGGGNSAGQAAVFLADHARKVWLLIRGDDVRKTMSHYLVRRIEQTPKIEVLHHTEISRMHGDQSLAEVEITCHTTNQTDTLPASAVFLFIGAVPHTRWLPANIEVDRNGFVKTGLEVGQSRAWPLRRQPFLLETTRPGVFAAGDVRYSSTKRVASAVGEGSMAVQLVHQYLTTS